MLPSSLEMPEIILLTLFMSWFRLPFHLKPLSILMCREEAGFAPFA